MELSRRTWLLAKSLCAEKSKAKSWPGTNFRSGAPARLTVKCKPAGWLSRMEQHCAAKLRLGGWRQPRLQRQPPVLRRPRLRPNPALLTLERRRTDEFPQQIRDWGW